MRIILLSALFAVAVGIGAMTSAAATPAAAGLNDAANATSLVQQARWYWWNRRRCYSRRVCYINHWGRRHCYWKRVCRY